MRTELPLSFWTMNPEYVNVTVTTKELRAIMLRYEGWISANGYIYDIQKKSLGGGVYNLTLKLRKYN